MKSPLPILVSAFLSGCATAPQAKFPAEEPRLHQAERIIRSVPKDNHYHYSGWPYWVVVTVYKENQGLQFDMFSKYLQDRSFRFIDRNPLGNADEVLFCDTKEVCKKMNVEKSFVKDTYMTLGAVTENAFKGRRKVQLENDLRDRYDTLREMMSLLKGYKESTSRFTKE